MTIYKLHKRLLESHHVREFHEDVLCSEVKENPKRDRDRQSRQGFPKESQQKQSCAQALHNQRSGTIETVIMAMKHAATVTKSLEAALPMSTE
jgi:hypothetical protein